MELVICKETEEVAEFADNWVARQVKNKQLQSLYVPAGATPELLYALWRQHRPEYLQSLQLVQIDDVLTGVKAHCFRDFFNQQLQPWLKQMAWLDQGDQQADATILGLGLNGHVAFHEPGLARTFFSGCVRLTPSTCERLSLTAGTWGISYGLAAFMNCREVLMLATGESKREVVQQLLNKNKNLPATELHQHPKFTLVLDKKSSPG